MALVGDGSLSVAEACKLSCNVVYIGSLKKSNPHTRSYCSECKLKSGKQCTPDSVDGVCCDSLGIFSLRSARCLQAGKIEGYCKAGKCLTNICPSDSVGVASICRGSKLYTCSAKCEGFHTINVCFGRNQIQPGTRLRIPNGQVCWIARTQSGCEEGPCSLPALTTTEFTTITAETTTSITETDTSTTGEITTPIFPTPTTTTTTTSADTITCPPGFKLTSECVPCGSSAEYCVDGVAKKVSPGYYSIGGTRTTRTGQSKCGGNEFYCIDGLRKRALETQYTTGGTPLTRTGVDKCKNIEHCATPVICLWENDPKCLECEESYIRVESKSDKCVLKGNGRNDKQAENCVVMKGCILTLTYTIKK